jgi:hypothetical protein
MASRQLTAAEKRVAKLRRYDALVKAAQEAITMLEAPFSPNDDIPGDIEDAVAILRIGLGVQTTTTAGEK